MRLPLDSGVLGSLGILWACLRLGILVLSLDHFEMKPASQDFISNPNTPNSSARVPTPSYCVHAWTILHSIGALRRGTMITVLVAF
jgi:hypothetical protein